jgi:hypothetical protein
MCVTGVEKLMTLERTLMLDIVAPIGWSMNDSEQHLIWNWVEWLTVWRRVDTMDKVHGRPRTV